MTWTVKYWPKETEKFLRKLGALDQAAIVQELEVLEKYGFSQHNDSLKKIIGTKNVWEIKVKQYRVFLIPLTNNTIQVLYVLRKKSNKTPKEAIDLVKLRTKIFG